MQYTIYEGDGQEVKVKNQDAWVPGEFVLETVRYIAKVNGRKQWYGVLQSGAVVAVVPKNKDRMRLVGRCAFHHALSNELIRSIQSGGKNVEQIKEVMKNRKRKLWEKEYRGG